MAEALAALGIACNVLAVIDFTWVLLTEAREIYKADTNASENVIFLETIVNDIKDHDDRLADSRTNDKNLKKLVEESRKITGQLSTALLSMKSEGRRSKWKSFKVALKEVWGDGKVKGLAEKVGSLQSQIARHLLISISDEVRETGRNIGALRAMISRLEIKNDQLGIERKESLKVLEENLIKAVKDAASANPNQLEQFNKALIMENDDLSNEKRSSHRLDSARILTAAQELREVAMLTHEDQNFLQTLYFQNQRSRPQHRTDEVHTNTFEWILGNDTHQGARGCKSDFKDWLEKKSGIYWICGKAGSGKSFLMEFLTEKNERTDQLLRIWAGGKRLVTANFYFRSAGEALQKSQEGLLRSIIFGLLRKCQYLIPAARSAANSRSGFARDNRSWEVKDLLSIYDAIVTHDADTKFCLFIDGLDEFGEEGRTLDHLLSTIRRLNRSPNIKLCLSSRPWMEFVDVFGKHRNHLKLEDLTRGDIERYVTDHFKSHPQFEILTSQDAAYADFIQSVLDRAQGVFLWVVLVMRELLKGLTHHDSLKMLQDRLDGFPPGLEEFFNALISSVDLIYHKQMAQYFYVTVTAKRPLPARYYSFMGDLEDPVAPAKDAILHRMSNQEKRDREERLRRRLDARTRGLLELKCPEKSQDVSRFWNSEVEFLHRTVRDFLNNSQYIQQLFEQVVADGHPFLGACKAILRSWKTNPYYGGDECLRKEAEQNDLVLFASLCRDTQDCEIGLQQILVAAEEADNHMRRSMGHKPRPRYFLEMGATIGLHDYLNFKLKSGPKLFASGGQLVAMLYCALLDAHVISLKCVTFLLEKGASPNEQVNHGHGDSVWHCFLKSLMTKKAVMDKTFLHDLLGLLVDYDADFTISPSNADVSSTVELLTQVLDEHMALHLHEKFLENRSRTRVTTSSTQGHGQERQQRRRSRILRWWFEIC